MRTRLNEAKSIGGHKSAKVPWRNHALVATLRTAVRPFSQKVREQAGRAKSLPAFSRLERSFKNDLTSIFNRVKSGESLSSKYVKGVFRKYYTQAFKLGKQAGGNTSITSIIRQEDRRWIETFLDKEFKYWKKFVNDIRTSTGKMAHDRRLNMYVSTLNSMFETSRVLETPPQTLYYWKTSPAEHCPECLFLARKSPFIKANLPTVPRSGDTICKSNCRCTLETKYVSLLEYKKVSDRSPTRKDLMREMKRLRR